MTFRCDHRISRHKPARSSVEHDGEGGPKRQTWNDTIDLYYERLGWDRATGWPTRETYERLGMTDVEAAMEAAGKIPDTGAPYTRKPSPFTVDGHFKPEDYEPVKDPKELFGAYAK